MRKVIQIAVSRKDLRGAAGMPTPTVLYTIALCDDGTMWERHGGASWIQVVDVPQPKKPGYD